MNVHRVTPLVAGPALMAFAADPSSFSTLRSEHVGVPRVGVRQRRYLLHPTRQRWMVRTPGECFLASGDGDV
jgi:hypothetical protein